MQSFPKKVWRCIMAHSKKEKIPKNTKDPGQKSIRNDKDPNQFYSFHPAWNFGTCDKKMWSLYSDEVKALFWEELMPRLIGLELQRWSDILVTGKKQNHLISPNKLNPGAKKRLVELGFGAEDIYSIRLNGTHRIYGYIGDRNNAFHILWVDLNHGDNEECVCRSHLKNT